MKLSALLLSINIVAAMPQLAQAGGEAVSDKADWLKQNLKTMASIGSATTCKLSMSSPSLPKKTKAVKLRSFVPNRPLLRQKDLDTYLVAQRANIDSSTPTNAVYGRYNAGEAKNNPVLSGLVSTYSLPNESRLSPIAPASYAYQPELVKRKFSGKSLPRAIPAQQPTLPGQVSALSNLYPAIPAIPEPPVLETAPIQPQPSVAHQQTSRPGEHLIQQSGALLVQAPALNLDEQSLLNELVKLNRPGRSAQFQDITGSQEQGMLPSQSIIEAQPRHDPGPPPFPLSLLPEDAINDLMHRGHARHIDAPAAYFGSWHTRASLSSLPKAGFKSYAGLRKAQGGSFTQYAHIKCQDNHRQRQNNRTQQSGVSASAALEPATTPAYQATMLVYPPYDKHYRISMF